MPISAAQKTAIEEVLSTLLGMHSSRGKRPLCGMFMELVDREEWPHYYEVIPEPRCINNIKAGLEKGRYKEASDVYTDLSLVFWNALFYNEPKSQIAFDAETLKKALVNEWKKKGVLSLPRTSPPPSSAQKVHATVTDQQPERLAKSKPAAQPRQTSSQPHTATTTTATTATPAPSTSKMARSTPVPSTSTTTLAKPVPIRPKSLQRQASADVEIDIMGEDETTGEEMVPERDPESEEIVKQLEKGLPRWPGFGEQGWMEEVTPDKMLELVQAIKNYKDIVGNKLSVSLEDVPEESTIPHLSYTTPLSLKLIESRARSKEYKDAKEFDKDMARLFEKARRYHEPSSEAYGHILLLQRLFQALTSPNPPPGPPFVSTQNFAALRAGPGTTKPVHGGDADGVSGVTTHRVLTRDRKFVDEVHYKGWSLKLADWVHLSNPDDPSRPIIAQVFRCWISEEATKAGQPGITVSWYYRPEQTFHPSERKFWEGEVFKTSHFADHPVEDIIEKIACQFTARHIRGRPRPPYWYLGFPLYVCDSRYNDRDRVFVKIKNWNSCIPEEVRKSTEFMPIYPFERTVYPIRYPSPFLTKGNKVKGPGGITPSAPVAEEGGDMEKVTANANTKKVSGGDTAGPSKGQYIGPSTMTVTATTTHNALSGSAAPTPQPQLQQLPVQQQPQAVVQPYRPPGPDRSVITAVGGASAQGSSIQVEKLPPETTKHFDRDPFTNEMLWFSAPPVDVARPPSTKHSLTYLHFLATKRKREREQQRPDDVNGTITNSGGEHEGVGDGLESASSKRPKVQHEVQPTVREAMRKLWVEMAMDI